MDMVRIASNNLQHFTLQHRDYLHNEFVALIDLLHRIDDFYQRSDAPEALDDDILEIFDGLAFDEYDDPL